MTDYEHGHTDGLARHSAMETRVACEARTILHARMWGLPDGTTEEYQRGWIDGFNEAARALRARCGLLVEPPARSAGVE